MNGANMIVGGWFANNNTAYCFDAIGDSWTDGPPYVIKDATNDILNCATSEKATSTILEFKIPMNSGDTQDKVMETNETTNFFFTYHQTNEDVFDPAITSHSGMVHSNPNKILFFRPSIEIDNTPPEIDSPEDIHFSEGTTGNTITWTVGDAFPNTYNITKNGLLYGTDTTWTNGTISVILDDLNKGIYNFLVSIYDESNNLISDLVIVTVTDDTPPEINNPDDIQYSEGSTGNSITWTVGDKYPGYYKVNKDGAEYVGNTTWVNGTIVVPIDGLVKGAYGFVITVYDGTGNSVIDTVLVAVQDSTNNTEITPTSHGLGLVMLLAGLMGLIMIRKKNYVKK